MMTVLVNGSKVVMTEETFAKWVEVCKAEAELKEAQKCLNMATHDVVNGLEGYDRSDLYDFESWVGECHVKVWEAWDRFTA